MKTILLTLIALAITLTSFGQAPEAFKYQAVVRDGGGIILTNQTVGYQLTILQGSPSGVTVYSETLTPTTNGYGLVNLEIGTGTTSYDFTTIDWANGPYFMETAVDLSGGTSYTVMGTSQLMSVPYALYAKTSGNGAGPQGIQGIAGNDGVDGVDGAVGATGPQGVQGIPGNDGANGANGLSAYEEWIALGNTGTETDFINSLTGPQGATGANGAVGATGVQGIQGLPGNDGANGTAGATGPQGVQGLPGIQGPAGNDGVGIAQTLSQTGSDVTLSDGGGTISVNDADNDPANELQDWTTLPGIPAGFVDGVDNVDDTDADPTNELQALSLSNDTLYLSEGNNVYIGGVGGSVNVSAIGVSTGVIADNDSILFPSYCFSQDAVWTCPNQVSQIIVELWGAGGGGGGGVRNATLNKNGGLGGLGGHNSVLVNVIPGQSYSIIIGQGGLGGTTTNGSCNCVLSGTAGLTGGSSSFDGSLIATGGDGGGPGTAAVDTNFGFDGGTGASAAVLNYPVFNLPGSRSYISSEIFHVPLLSQASGGSIGAGTSLQNGGVGESGFCIIYVK